MSTVEHSVFDGSARPRAQLDEVATDASGLAAGQHLVQVHDHFRSEIAALRDVVAQVRRGALDVATARSTLNDMTLRANTWAVGSMCQGYCHAITQHHLMEDMAVFPHLGGADKRLAAVLDRLSLEHVVIHDLIEAVDAALVDLVRDPSDHGQLTLAVDRLGDALLSHFDYEETELVGPLTRLGFFEGQL
jgi:hypothetical protein